MQYFLLYQLRYWANYEDWATVENATSWSHKANNSTILHCGATPMGNPKMLQKTRKENKSGRKTEFLP